MSVLAQILAAKRDEVDRLVTSADALRRAAADAPPPRDALGALRRADGRVAVIAEIKRRSPSKGDLAPDLDAATTAASYERGGAAVLSVLTDSDFFGGSLDDLRVARAACSLPVLRKDFTIHEVQVFEARAAGADAILLIVAAIPDDAVLRSLRVLAEALGMPALVEAHDAREVERALGTGARVVGVNCRDLGSFAEDLGVAVGLAPSLPQSVVAVAESAIRSPQAAAAMAAAGYDAVLVGEVLVRSDDPSSLVAALTGHRVTPRGEAA